MSSVIARKPSSRGVATPDVVDQDVEPVAGGGYQSGRTVGLGQVDGDRFDGSTVGQLPGSAVTVATRRPLGRLPNDLR
jgi:hypothetical protein